MQTAINAGLQKKFKYHHGELRGALIEAALDILKSEGVEALSLRGLAKKTGVTAAAPYSHFADKDELLAAVAEAGFQRLALQMAADATGFKDVSLRIEKLIVSYIRFASENKTLFQLMFGRELADMKRYPTLAMTAGKSYSLFATALSTRIDKTADTAFLTVTLWSMCHGLTTLIVDNKINLQQFKADGLDDFIKRVVGLLGTHLQ